MSIFTMPEDISGGRLIGRSLGAGLGEGINQGITSRLQNMLEQNKNTSSASDLSTHLNLQGEAKNNFINAFRNIPSKDQPAALAKIAEAQAYSNYQSQQNGRAPENPEFEEGQPVKIGGFDFDRSELPPREENIPPYGPHATAAQLQQKQKLENRKSIDKYSEGYEDPSKLRTIVNKQKEAKRLIEEGDIDTGVIHRGLVAILEGKESALAEIAKTPDQQKLLYLMRDSLKTKQEGGSNPSTREVLISMSTIPSYLKGKEANEYIVNRILKDSEKNLAKGELIQGLRKYDNAMDPGQFKDLVENKIKTLDVENEEPSAPEKKSSAANIDKSKEVIMIDPQGNRRAVPKSQAKEAQEAGYKLVQ